MTYIVTWRPTCEARLADLWTSGPDREQIAAAADRIDALLRLAPLEQGESRWGVTRILIESPLAVYYDVKDDDREVAVWAVWRWGRL